MASYKIFLLPGDGIGPEVTAEVEKVAKVVADAGLASFEFEKGLVGGAAYDAHGQAISEDDMARAQAADAVLLAAVGGPKKGKSREGAPRGTSKGEAAAISRPFWRPERRKSRNWHRRSARRRAR